MSDVRPSGEGDGAARLLAFARARRVAVAADLSLPGAFRLSEWQRGTLASLYAAVVRDAEDELRALLLARLAPHAPEALKAALGSAGLALALPLLDRGSVVADPNLVALLLRRTEEHRLASGAAEHGLLAALSGDEDAAVAAEAMGLLIARNSRFDTFQEPLVGRSDLPADLRHRLLWTVAAALRTYLVDQHRLDPGAADAALAGAVASAMPGYDEAAGVEARTLRLAALLAARGRLDDALIGRASEEGNLPVLLAAVAIRAGIGFEAAWELVGESAGAPLLLRAAKIARPTAGAILYRLGGEAAAAAQLDRFDTLSENEAMHLLGPWRADSAYRAALAELAS